LLVTAAGLDLLVIGQTQQAAEFELHRTSSGLACDTSRAMMDD
jgi:hypothetical protein